MQYLSNFSASSLQIIRKLMLDYGGLDNLVEMVCNCDNNGVQQTAISSLVFLLQSIKCQSSLRVQNYGEPIVFLAESIFCGFLFCRFYFMGFYFVFLFCIKLIILHKINYLFKYFLPYDVYISFPM